MEALVMPSIIVPFEEQPNLLRLADAQKYFIEKYTDKLWDQTADLEEQNRVNYELRSDFHRDFDYIIGLTYREAQAPLVKQLTDYRISNPRKVE